MKEESTCIHKKGNLCTASYTTACVKCTNTTIKKLEAEIVQLKKKITQLSTLLP